jgi:hypothetical protein
VVSVLESIRCRCHESQITLLRYNQVRRLMINNRFFLAMWTALSVPVLLSYSKFADAYSWHAQTVFGPVDYSRQLYRNNEPGRQKGNAGRLPNTATRYEETSVSEKLFCGSGNDTFKSGYAHFTNANGVEDKHLFWWCASACS